MFLRNLYNRTCPGTLLPFVALPLERIRAQRVPGLCFFEVTMESIYVLSKTWQGKWISTLLVSLSSALPYSCYFPPRTTDAHPNNDIDDTDESSQFPPSAHLHVARPKEQRGRPRTIVGHAAEQVAKES